ncbi:unnamed protein product, partial [Ectocarpus sp. 8 AP-2014]
MAPSTTCTSIQQAAAQKADQPGTASRRTLPLWIVEAVPAGAARCGGAEMAMSIAASINA